MRSDDSFRLIDETTAGAVIGAVVAALVIYDILQRVREWFLG